MPQISWFLYMGKRKANIISIIKFLIAIPLITAAGSSGYFPFNIKKCCMTATKYLFKFNRGKNIM